MEPITIWTAIASIAACFAAVIALIPIFINWYEKRKYLDYLRSTIRSKVSNLLMMIDLTRKQVEIENWENTAIQQIALSLRDLTKDIHKLSNDEYAAYFFLEMGVDYIRPGICIKDDAWNKIIKSLKLFMKYQKKGNPIVFNEEQSNDLKECFNVNFNK